MLLAFGFDQRRRQEIFAARLPSAWIIYVASKVRAAALNNQRFKLPITDSARIIEREREPKRRIRMYACANWIILLRQERNVLFGKGIGQWLKIP